MQGDVLLVHGCVCLMHGWIGLLHYGLRGLVLLHLVLQSIVLDLQDLMISLYQDRVVLE